MQPSRLTKQILEFYVFEVAVYTIKWITLVIKAFCLHNGIRSKFCMYNCEHCFKIDIICLPVGAEKVKAWLQPSQPINIHAKVII